MLLLTSLPLNHQPLIALLIQQEKPSMAMITHLLIPSVIRVTISGGKLISKTRLPLLVWKLLAVSTAVMAVYMIMISSSWIRT